MPDDHGEVRCQGDEERNVRGDVDRDEAVTADDKEEPTQRDDELQCEQGGLGEVHDALVSG